MKSCSNCGKENQDIARFCAECGAQLEETGLTQVPAVPVKPTAPAACDRNHCLICGKKFNYMSSKVNCLDGSICNECYEQFMPIRDSETLNRVENSTWEEFWEITDEKKMQLVEVEKARELKRTFSCNYQIGEWAFFNDDANEMMLAKVYPTYGFDPDLYEIFSYDQIIDYELLEDGASILKGGVGRAAVGKLLFGNTGAIIGGLTRKQKAVCNSMQIKFTVKNSHAPAFYMQMINKQIKKDSINYKEISKCAQDILSKLQIIGEENEEAAKAMTQQPDAVRAGMQDPVEEIRRFKELLDEGILTQEEFMAKKKQILGI